MARTALITGATSGIGEATARLLAKNDFRLILCGRRKERLELLHQQLSPITGVISLVFDIRNKKEVGSSFKSLPAEWKEIDILLNNAGNAHGFDLFHEGNLKDWEAMIDINVKGLLYISRLIVPGMVARRRGHIINIGSIAGKEVYPKGNVYCASKYAVDAISAGMRMDLNDFGIKVSEINPGMVETEFALVRYKGDKEKAKNTYQGLKPLTGQDIAEIILFILTRPDHVNLSDVIVFPTAQASATIVKREIT
jgi:3-hydroxy acid dehydrogenase / malonic semialdehyde reductase